jgi:hypothetical protein
MADSRKENMFGIISIKICLLKREVSGSDEGEFQTYGLLLYDYMTSHARRLECFVTKTKFEFPFYFIMRAEYFCISS